MIARTYSLYWDNVDPEMVIAQKSVFDHLGLGINQHRIHGIDHGEWIDWVMTRNDDVDVFAFIDLDCVPLSKNKFVENVENSAKNGTLIGAEGAANHIDPNRSYTGAWYIFVNRKAWNIAKRPSAKATAYGDVCQEWTETWKRYNFPLSFIPPTSCITPRWNLPGRPNAYGVGTTYGNDCFHLFEARNKANQAIFLAKCEEIKKSATA